MRALILVASVAFIAYDALAQGRFSLPPGSVKWAFETGAEVAGSPAVGPDGTVYVRSTDERIYALEGSSGTKRWEYRTGEISHWPLAMAVGEDGTVYVASAYRLSALDGGTGVARWQVGGEQADCQAIAIAADGTVYAGWRDGRVEAFESLTGTRRWSSRPTTSCTDLIVGADGTLFMSSSKAKGVYALDPVAGAKRWESELKAPVIEVAAGGDGMLYASDSSPKYDGRLFALDVVTGRTRWEWKSAMGPANPAVGEAGVVWVADGSLKMLDGPTGQQIGEVPADDSSVVMEGWPAIAATGTVYVAANVRGIGGIYVSGRLYAVDSMTRSLLWSFTPDGALRGSPTIGPEGTVYVGAVNPEACCEGHGVPYPIMGRRSVYALVGTAPPAATPWPMYRHDAQHTGRAVAPPTPLRLAISWHEDKARIEWTTPAILQAGDILVPVDWQDLSEATSPYEVEPANAQRFYRLRRPRRARRGTSRAVGPALLSWSALSGREVWGAWPIGGVATAYDGAGRWTASTATAKRVGGRPPPAAARSQQRRISRLHRVSESYLRCWPFGGCGQDESGSVQAQGANALLDAPIILTTSRVHLPWARLDGTFAHEPSPRGRQMGCCCCGMWRM